MPDEHQVEFHTPPAGSTPEAVVNALATLQQLPVSDGKASTTSRLVFHIIAIQRALVALFSGGNFDRILEPNFVFDDIAYCIAIGSQIAVLNKDNCHRTFRFFAEVL